MQMDNALREYVRAVITEDLFFRGFGAKPQKRKSIVRTIKDKLGIDRAGSFAGEWIDDQEDEYDFEMSDGMKERVTSFINKKYNSLYLKYQDKKKVETKLTSSLRKVFGKYLLKIRRQREQEEAMEDETLAKGAGGDNKNFRSYYPSELRDEDEHY